MTDTTFKIGERNYRIERMDARMQFHIATKFAKVASGFADGDQAGAISEAISRLSTDDADFIINACLSVVSREDAGGAIWSPVMVNGQIMFDDLRTSLAAMMQMIIPVVRLHVSGFLSELPKDFLAKLIAAMPKGLSLPA